MQIPSPAIDHRSWTVQAEACVTLEPGERWVIGGAQVPVGTTHQIVVTGAPKEMFYVTDAMVSLVGEWGKIAETPTFTAVAGMSWGIETQSDPNQWGDPSWCLMEPSLGLDNTLCVTSP